MPMNTVIIGGTSGIGLETAHYLKKIGYNVVVGGRKNFKNDSGLHYAKIDVTDESSIQQFFSSLPFERIDSVIYSSGQTTNKKSIQDFDVDEYKRVHDVNLLGAILTLKYAFPKLKDAKGKVVIIGSCAVRTYSMFSGFEYTVTKAGLSGLVKQLAMEWANDGVLINNVHPSMVETPMLIENVKPSVLDDINKNLPLGRIAKPEEVASIIEFLVSNKNTYITGAGIDINGGQYLSA